MPTYQDHIIWTASSDTKLSFTYRDFAKTHANPDMNGNSLNRRAIGYNFMI
jgi:hypothetical protein